MAQYYLLDTDWQLQPLLRFANYCKCYITETNFTPIPLLSLHPPSCAVVVVGFEPVLFGFIVSVRLHASIILCNKEKFIFNLCRILFWLCSTQSRLVQKIFKNDRSCFEILKKKFFDLCLMIYCGLNNNTFISSLRGHRVI